MSLVCRNYRGNKRCFRDNSRDRFSRGLREKNSKKLSDKSVGKFCFVTFKDFPGEVGFKIVIRSLRENLLFKLVDRC